MYLIALFGTNISGRELAVIAVVIVVIVAIAWYLMSRRRATGGR